MATGAGRGASPTDVADAAAVRPAWLKTRSSAGAPTDELPAADSSDFTPVDAASAASSATNIDGTSTASLQTSAVPSPRARRTSSARPVPRGSGRVVPDPILTIEPSEPDRPKTWAGWLGWLLFIWQGWWSGLYAGWGITVSLLLHSSACVVLGLIFYTASSERGALVSGTFDVAQDGEDLEIPVDTRLDTSFGDSVANETFVAAAGNDAPTMESLDNLLGSSEGTGDAEGNDGAGASMLKNIRVPESAITRGSFTVWTEPEDPAPRQSYDIVIQVKVPKATKQFKLNDLSGRVIGTDGYRKEIKYGSKDRRGVKDGVVQLTVRIPGAATLVKDVIEIRSKMLKEEQRIEILF